MQSLFVLMLVGDLLCLQQLDSAGVLDAVKPEPVQVLLDRIPTVSEVFEAAARRDGLRLAAAPGGVAEASSGYSDRPIVVIDPGHGGVDSGAVSKDGLKEKDVVLEFGRELADQLRSGGEVQPVLTREKDEYLSLSDRVGIAHRHGATLFISIHVDRVAQKHVRGATIYTLSEGEPTDGLAEAVAVRENRSDTFAGRALEYQPKIVADVLADLLRRETRTLSARFAETLIEDMGAAMTLNTNPFRRAGFKVLKAPDMPSILLELGFLSNEQDRALFRSEKWPTPQAKSVARAIEKFFAD